MVCVWYILIPGCFQNHIHKKQLTSSPMVSNCDFGIRICVFTFYTNVFRILLYNSCDLCESSDGAVMLYFLYLQLHVAYTHRPQSTAERAVTDAYDISHSLYMASNMVARYRYPR